ncbi:MAG: outer membrane protein assembly factor BamB family protein, partial [Planctomycetota bacterium]
GLRIRPKLLEHANLEMIWDRELVLGKDERLERLDVAGESVYALSNLNNMCSIDRRTGNVVFTRAFGRPGFAVLGLQMYEQQLISIVGDRLVEVDPEFGRDVRGRQLEFGVTCPAARNRGFFYIAGADRRLRVMRAKDQVKLFEVAAENDSLITSVAADDGLAIFGTDAGNVIAIAPDRPTKRWQFDASDGIVGPIVRDAQWLYVSSRDTYVYKLDVLTGSPPVWGYQTGAILDRGPVVTERAVYQYVRNKGLTAIDKQTGKSLWQVEEGSALLAEAGRNAYVLTSKGELVVMDNERQKRLYSVNLAGVSRYATNTADSHIYVADEFGRIVCLRPTE